MVRSFTLLCDVNMCITKQGIILEEVKISLTAVISLGKIKHPSIYV